MYHHLASAYAGATLFWLYDLETTAHVDELLRIYVQRRERMYHRNKGNEKIKLMKLLSGNQKF